MPRGIANGTILGRRPLCASLLPIARLFAGSYALATAHLDAEKLSTLLDYLHRERNLFLRARVSGTSDWAGWPFLLHALWERLVFRNNTKLALKLLDICFRFMAVKLENASEAVLLEHLVAKIKSGLSQTDVMLASVNLLDGQEITQAYINQFAGDSNSPTTELSHAFFNWVTISLDATRADLVYKFLVTSINHLWMVMEDMGDGERIEYIQLAHFMAFATDVIVHVQNYMDMLMQLNLPKDSTRLLGGVLLVDSKIINLIAWVLTFPLLLKELENLSDVDKS
ncbi:hypothetical protein FRC09_010068 [Ceratobasidium sp. 395]|nr:hypothetical protein FRC09_010068 [Ceratobasidium sp. 395]